MGNVSPRRGLPDEDDRDGFGRWPPLIVPVISRAEVGPAARLLVDLRWSLEANSTASTAAATGITFFEATRRCGATSTEEPLGRKHRTNMCSYGLHHCLVQRVVPEGLLRCPRTGIAPRAATRDFISHRQYEEGRDRPESMLRARVTDRDSHGPRHRCCFTCSTLIARGASLCSSAAPHARSSRRRSFAVSRPFRVIRQRSASPNDGN